MIVARRYLIAGRVQAVGFRFFAYDAAVREGIRGWVRNVPDRRVEVMAEGDADAMDRFELAIRRGPAGARVDDVTVEIVPPTGKHGDFGIRG
jgi:acylphosphatase